MKNRETFSEYASKRVAVIMSTRNRKDMTIEALDYLEKSGDREIFDLFIVDSNSTDGLAEWLFKNMRNKANLIFDYSEDLGYAESNNRIMKMCRDYPFLYLVNNDLFVCEHWLSEAIKCADRHPEAGHIASKQLNRDYTIQAAGAFKARDGQTICAYARKDKDYLPANEEYEVDYAGFGLYLQSTIQKIGYLEERYWPIYFDDDDWGLRVEMVGLKTIYCPTSEVRHVLDHTNREHHRGAARKNLAVFQSKFQEHLKTRQLRVREGANPDNKDWK